MDTQDKQAARGIAAEMAEMLVAQSGVHAIWLDDITHHTDGPPYYTGPEYRLMAVVDDELSLAYSKRMMNPCIIPLIDGDDNGNTWSTKRTETPQEAVFAVLGTDEEEFYESLRWTFNITKYDARIDRTVELILLPESWPTEIYLMLRLLRGEITDQNNSTSAAYEVYDPKTHAFSPR